MKAAGIEAGPTWNGLTVVQKGLEEGAKIVVAGGFKLNDGMKVNVAR